MTTDQLLDQIAQRGLLTSEQLGRVRTAIGKAPGSVSANSLARQLVDKGMLTASQAQALLGAQPAAQQPAPSQPPAKPTPNPTDELDELSLQPLEEDAPRKPVETLPDLVELDELPSAPRKPETRRASQPSASAKSPASTSQSAPRKSPAAADQPDSLLSELDSLDSPSLAGSPLDLLSANAALTDGSPLLAAPRKKGFRLFGSKEPKKLKKPEDEWESPLLLFGGGALLLLLIVGGGVFFLYLKGRGDQQFAAAEEDYKGGSYTQAIAKFTSYISQNPKHASVGIAKVHRGIARLRQATQSSDFSHALSEAQAVTAELEHEKEFSEARLEFRSLLPDIAEGLANEAAKPQEPDKVKAKLAEADEALKLVMNVSYIPESQRPLERIGKIRETMAVANRELERDAALTDALARIGKAAAQADIAAAYADRKKLLKTYPELAKNESLAKAVLEIAGSEKAAVRVSDDGRKGQTNEPDSPIIGSLAIAERAAKGNPPAGPPIALLVDGSACGFDSGNGDLLWTRFVGVESFPPVPASTAADGDWLIVDAGHSELLRLKGVNGQLVWRQPISDRITGLATVGKQAVVSSLGGKLIVVELENGNVTRTATLPQSARLPLAVNAATGRLYQVAEQSTIYVFSSDLNCLQAYHLGHETGTVAVTPLLLPKHLVVVENSGAHRATIHVLELGDDGVISTPRQQIALPERVVSEPVIGDRKLVVATDAGHLKVMGVNPSNVESPLADLASQPPASNDRHSLRRLRIESSNLWIADQKLMRYSVQSAAGRIVPAPLEDDYDAVAFDGPLHVVGNLLIHARRTAGRAATSVTGTRLSDGQRLWETRLGAPIVGEPVARGDLAVVVNADGRSASVTAESLQKGVLNLAADAAEIKPPLALHSQTLLNDGSVLFAAPRDARMLILARQSADTRLIAAPDELACPPVALGKGILAPTHIGQVFWLNPANGKPVAAPFQPQVSADAQIPWTTPGVTGDDNTFAISDGPRVYRVGLVREPESHLEALATSEELAEPIQTPIATLDKFAFAANRSGAVQVFELPEMTLSGPIALDADVTWGPRRIANFVLVATAGDELVAIDENAKVAWRHPLRFGPLAGTPAVAGDALLIAALDGHVEKLSLRDGGKIASANVGQPLGAGLVPFGKDWLTASADGTVLLVRTPDSESAATEGGTGE